MMEYIPDELIVKYLRKELSEQESVRMNDWLLADKNNRDFLFRLEELYWASRYEEMKELADTNNEWKKLKLSLLKAQGVEASSKRTVYLKRLLKYAAVISISLSIPSLLNFFIFDKSDEKKEESFATVITGKGERSQLILPDGSQVWLNSASSISYNSGATSERKVRLSGEAYFDVVKDKERPFIVETNLIKIKVLGTKFNLKNFEEDGYAETTLYEGSISANTPDGEFKQDLLLEPGQQLYYSQDKTLTLSVINNTYDREWKNGVYHFKKQSLAHISQNLERTFNVEIVVTDENLAQQEFTCEFENAENFHDILEVLRMTGRINYHIKGNQVTISEVVK